MAPKGYGACVGGFVCGGGFQGLCVGEEICKGTVSRGGVWWGGGCVQGRICGGGTVFRAHAAFQEHARLHDEGFSRAVFST